MRTKSLSLTSLLVFLFTYSLAQISYSRFDFSATENYQPVFFTTYYYDDFSYRFIDNHSILQPNFGKKIGLPFFKSLSFSDSLLLDSLKAKSNVYLVLGSQKNQCLQLVNLQRIGHSTLVYFNYSSVASLGFLKNNNSKNRSFNLSLIHKSKSYGLEANFIIASNNDGCSGGVSDSVLNTNYSKRDLQQLEVNLNTDYLKKKFFKIDLDHTIKLYESENKMRNTSMIVGNSFSKFGYNYKGEGISQFYPATYYDSTATNDSLGYDWFKNYLGVCFIIDNVTLATSIERSDFNFNILDSSYLFGDFALNSDLAYNIKNVELSVRYCKNLGNNFRKNNSSICGTFGIDINSSFLKKLILSFSAENNNVQFTYQKLFSNHYVWNNDNFSNVKSKNGKLSVLFSNNILMSASLLGFRDRVFLNEKIVPTVSNKNESLISIGLCYNDTISRFHIIQNTNYNKSNSEYYPVIPIQSFVRVGYLFDLFKNNLKMEAGFSCVYNDSWLAPNYLPALDDFYIQSQRKYNGIAVLNFFADFKIKAATLFLKIERVNIGWMNEQSFLRNGYVIPPRTIRFGFNWPLVN